MNKLKKALLGLVAVFACSLSANADTGIYNIMNDSFTIVDVAISSHPTGGTRQIFTASLNGATTSFLTLMESRKVMEIQNIDSTSSVFCRVGLSSTSANGDLSLSAPVDLSITAGRKIAAGGSWVLGLPARDRDGRVFLPWCVNNSASGTIKLTISQGRTK